MKLLLTAIALLLLQSCDAGSSSTSRKAHETPLQRLEAKAAENNMSPAYFLEMKGTSAFTTEVKWDLQQTFEADQVRGFTFREYPELFELLRYAPMVNDQALAINDKIDGTETVAPAMRQTLDPDGWGTREAALENIRDFMLYRASSRLSHDYGAYVTDPAPGWMVAPNGTLIHGFVVSMVEINPKAYAASWIMITDSFEVFLYGVEGEFNSDVALRLFCQVTDDVVLREQDAVAYSTASSDEAL